jgi:hypothetical protein
VASVAIALTALAVLGVVTPEGLTLGWVGLDSILVALAYAASETRISRLEPDALLLLLAYVGTLIAVWSVGAG